MVYNYSFVIKADDKPPVAIAECTCNDHHEFEVAYWLAKTKERFSQVTNSLVVPFKCIIVDMSWALTNAILQQFCCMDLMQYLNACMRAKGTLGINFVIVAWCYAHFQHAIVRQVAKLLPIARYKYSPARRLLKFVAAALARTTTLEEALDIFKLVIPIVKSRKSTKQMTDALMAMAVR